MPRQEESTDTKGGVSLKKVGNTRLGVISKCVCPQDDSEEDLSGEIRTPGFLTMVCVRSVEWPHVNSG